MEPEDQARLAAYCRILEVPVDSTAPNPALALQVLARMYLVPTIPDKQGRLDTVNEIRANLAGHFDNYSVFTWRTAQLAALMVDFPYIFIKLNQTTEALIEEFKSLSTGILILGALGIGAVATAVPAGLAEASKQNSMRAGLERGARRLAGQGPLLEEAQRRMGPRLTPARAGIVGVVVIVGGTLAYHSAVEQQETIRAIILDRFQKDLDPDDDYHVSDDQYRDVFGNHIDPQNLKRYWEL